MANALRTTESSRLYAAQASQPARTEKSKFFKNNKKEIHLIHYISHYAAVNTVSLLGRVGADPQLRGSTDHPVVTFSLATHTNYK